MEKTDKKPLRNLSFKIKQEVLDKLGQVAEHQKRSKAKTIEFLIEEAHSGLSK